MRILQVHNFYRQAGGEDVVVANERALLVNHGHKVYTWTTSNDAITGFWERARVAVQTPYSPSAREKMQNQIIAFAPDIVHVHNFFPLLSPSIYDSCRDMGVPIVQTLHNFRTICAGSLLMRDLRPCEDCIGSSPYQAVLHGCYRGSRLGSLAVARMIDMHHKKGTWRDKVDRFIALTHFGKAKFVEAGFPAEKIVVKPNFVEDRHLVRAGDAGRAGALFVGRLSPEKGIYTLVKAWSTLDVPLRVIGDGPLLDVVRDATGPDIVSLGRTAPGEVAAEMERASFLVFPSEWYEGFPITIAEAFSRSLPVIASRLGAMAEIVEDGITGLHFAAGDTRDLASKVEWAVMHPERMLEMGRNARKKYEEKYTPEKNLKELMNVYSEAIISND